MATISLLQLANAHNNNQGATAIAPASMEIGKDHPVLNGESGRDMITSSTKFVGQGNYWVAKTRSSWSSYAPEVQLPAVPWYLNTPRTACHAPRGRL
jgi:hypothetical protein